jgi:WhiB family redox-sensing transcriptional regulator
MYSPGTTADLRGSAGFEAESAQVAAATAGTAILTGPVSMAGMVNGLLLPCSEDPELFFAESPSDVETAKALCQGCAARLGCLTGARERREPWGVWGGELFLRGEVVPRKRPRGRPRKTEVAA